MFGYFYIPRPLNDMKFVVWKNHLGGEILYKSPDPVKNGVFLFGDSSEDSRRFRLLGGDSESTLFLTGLESELTRARTGLSGDFRRLRGGVSAADFLDDFLRIGDLSSLPKVFQPSCFRRILSGRSSTTLATVGANSPSSCNWASDFISSQCTSLSIIAIFPENKCKKKHTTFGDELHIILHRRNLKNLRAFEFYYWFQLFS